MKKKSKKSVGRPALPESDRRTNLGIPFSPAERKLIRKAADAAGKPLTRFVRDLVLEHIGQS